MDTLDRYLFKEFFLFFTVTVLGLVALYLGIDLLSKGMGSPMPFGQLMTYYLFKVPKTAQLFVPVGCLLSTLIILSNMSKQNEILAVFSCGIGNFRILSSFIAMAATISTFSFLAFDSVVPVFNKKEKLMEQGLDPSKDEFMPANLAGYWFRSGNLIYNVGHFSHQTNMFENIRLYDFDSNFYMNRMIRAKRARYTGDSWVVEDGSEMSFPKSPGFPIYRKFTSIPGIQLEKPTEFKSIEVSEELMRLKDLRRYIERNQNFGFDITVQKVKYHERLAMVFTPLIFVLLAVPFATKPLRNHSTARSFGFCFLVVFIYLLTSKMAIAIGKGGFIPPMISAWFTNLVFLLFSGFLMLRR